MAAEEQFVQVIIGVGILLFAAKLLAELFQRLHLPVVLGELLAGMIVGPFAIGQFLVINEQQLITLSPELKTLGDIGAIVILFIAGLEITPKEFFRGGKSSFVVGTLGVIVPFFLGFFIFDAFGFEAFQSMLIATALTATSIAITIQVLGEFGKLRSPEARLIIGAAIVDDILAIAVLSVVTSFAGSGGAIDVDPLEVMFVVGKVLGFFAVLLISAIFIMPKLIAARVWKSKGSVEGIATASFFGMAALAGSIGLSPIVGSFAVGMALSSTNLFPRIEEFVNKLGLIFAPLFFALIGAQVDFRGINMEVLMLSGILVAIAIVSKLFGCGLPSMMFLKDKKRGMRVGIGMISRGEVGLIVAGVGLSTGALSSDVYSTIVIMVAITTIITPIWLKASYKKEGIGKGSNRDSDKAEEETKQEELNGTGDHDTTMEHRSDGNNDNEHHGSSSGGSIADDKSNKA